MFHMRRKKMTSEQVLFQALVNGITGAMVLILVASGLSLIFGIMHIINLAHGEFFMLGGFGAWLFFAKHPIPLGPDVPRYLVAIILSIILVGTIGVFVERVVFRRFHGNLRACIVAAVGITFILQASMLVIFGTMEKSFSSPFMGKLEFANLSLSQERFAAIIIGIVFIGAMYLFIKRTKTGKAMRAVAQDREAAALQGINTGLTFSLAMGVGCALAAVGGALIGPVYVVNPYMGVEPIMKAFVVIILGGLGSLPGAVIGGLIIGLVESFIATYVGAYVALMAVYLVLIIILLLKPTGLLGHAE
jgi:branched-chain amino acid transport system permease protein